jgi:hypothetical protein
VILTTEILGVDFVDAENLTNTLEGYRYKNKPCGGSYPAGSLLPIANNCIYFYRQTLNNCIKNIEINISGASKQV